MTEEEAVAAALGWPTCQECGSLLLVKRHRRRRRTNLLYWRFCTRPCQKAALKKLKLEELLQLDGMLMPTDAQTAVYLERTDRDVDAA